jgi:hypothetical protein
LPPGVPAPVTPRRAPVPGSSRPSGTKSRRGTRFHQPGWDELAILRDFTTPIRCNFMVDLTMSKYYDQILNRRAEFGDGTPVVLADGREWVLPGPVASPRPMPERDALLASIVEAEDAVERLRADLAFGIYLIALNYELPSGAIGDLLGFHPDDPSLSQFQDVLHEVATAHVRVFRRRIDPAAHPRPGLFDRMRFVFKYFSSARAESTDLPSRPDCSEGRPNDCASRRQEGEHHIHI